MFKKGSTLLATAAFVFSVSICSTGYTKSGVSEGTSLPPGKPFQTIQTNLDSLQSQIDGLVGSTESLEERVAALEAAILELQAQDVALQAFIDANAEDITELRGLIDANAVLIEAMEGQIADIYTTLAEKQNIINGTCAAGSSIRVINEDGSVVCEDDDIGDIGGLVTATSSSFVDVPAAFASRDVTATCPTGYLVTGGGFNTNSDLTYVYESMPSGNGWYVGVINNWLFSADTVFVYAKCIKLQ